MWLTFITEIDFESSEIGCCKLLVDGIRGLTLIGRRIVQSYMDIAKAMKV